ncbi:MAG: hypothetical protein N2Z22_03260 [Turneriella sp.]|nr:hypothetical protein [Turneriella sp.]
MVKPAKEQALAARLLAESATLTLPEERQRALLALRDYLLSKKAASQIAQLVFICTHNSRRSQFAQAMTQLLSAYCNLNWIQSYSGGTEVTAFHPTAVAALRGLGFAMEKISEGENPRYRVAAGDLVAEFFSKKFDDPPNPKAQFAAVMVCSSADAGCPFVPGADVRIRLPFEDPKDADGTPQAEEVYRTRALEIGRTLAWLFRQL